MILHTPVLSKQDGQVLVAARVETQSAIPNLPKELWYRFPERYEEMVGARADGFAATTLLTAMYCGEDLNIRGPISPRLAYGLLEYRNIFHGWLPKIFHMVDVSYEKVEIAQMDSKLKGVGAAFSGGVDSFYTLWAHQAENQPIAEARITHGLFIHGFDLRLSESASFLAIAKKYEQLFGSLGLDLITASSNAHQFAEFRVDWVYFSGAPLIGAATILSPFFRRFYVPSTYSYNGIVPQGSSPLLDHLLSSESLDIVHHGASTNRFKKMRTLADWPVSYDLLRVCANQNKSDGLKNCSNCHKCYLTMTTLSILDTLPMYTTFAEKLTFWNYFHWGLHTHMNLPLARDIRRRAWKAGKIGLALGLWMAISINIVLKATVKAIKFMLPPKILYQIKMKLYKTTDDRIKS
jgi:hypothetical protein